MPVARTSISISLELDQALLLLMARTGQPKSNVIEMILREHPMVQHEIETIRLELRVKDVVAIGPGGRARLRRAKPVQRA